MCPSRSIPLAASTSSTILGKPRGHTPGWRPRGHTSGFVVQSAQRRRRTSRQFVDNDAWTQLSHDFGQKHKCGLCSPKYAPWFPRGVSSYVGTQIAIRRSLLPVQPSPTQHRQRSLNQFHDRNVMKRVESMPLTSIRAAFDFMTKIAASGCSPNSIPPPGNVHMPAPATPWDSRQSRIRSASHRRP